MRTPRLVVALLIICALVILALQNLSPSLPLVFLGISSAALPLGVWLSGAIALGALTALFLMGADNLRVIAPEPRGRRQWTVRPEPSPTDTAGRPWDRPTPPREVPRRPQPSTAFTGERPPEPSARTAEAAEDWQTWGQRTPVSQWEDWSQAGTGDARTQPFSRRQRKDRETAEQAIEDMTQGWDDSAQDTVYVAPGGSDVEDVLDDIAEGWDDWENEAPAPAETAYSYGYQGAEKATRRDSIYGPPDDEREASGPWRSPTDRDEEDWSLEEAGPLAPDQDAENTEEGEGVYDAEYRVIIPPYRDLDPDDDRREESSS